MGESSQKYLPNARYEGRTIRQSRDGQKVQIGDARVVYPESPHVSAWFQSEIESWILEEFHEEVKVDPLPTLDSKSASTRLSSNNHQRG
ncbi:hypothetical protein [Alicyclobacillus ferrooxydans]|uniref:Uncharacterized protein n=1 Tax=Alicyclobacillus ferrooxydans TaxID=471514 RepID=A0A0P9D0D7_9BACL|nr:hypothetical protein [Alicyclobacillus ferrooxydans]KPV45482.1 hypothetical protein AN477_00515 [Alicyclobacillus ferrooxydans]